MAKRRRDRILIRDTRLMARLERSYTRRLHALQRKLATGVANNVTASGVVPETVYEEYERALAQLLLRSSTAVAQAFGKLQNADLKGAGHEFETKNEDLFQEFITSWLQQNAAAKATTITATQIETVRRITSKLQATELIGQEALARALRKEITSFSPFQSARIARTETHTAAMISKQTMAETSGVIGLRKEWLSAEDSRVRETHNEVDGAIIPVDDRFSVGEDHLLFPGDPAGSAKETINCRCSLAYE